MKSQRGHFIVVEGLEGAGKSTAISTIKRFLTDKIDEVIFTREPGGTRVGEAVRHLIKDIVPEEPLDSRAELLLFYAARVQLLEQVIKPALGRGCWVLADRFELSTFAYQGGGRKLDHQMITNLSSFCLGGFQPDLIIFLDVTPQKGLQRAYKRGKTDRIEQEALSFFNDVYTSYHNQMKTMKNVVIIDACQPLKVVQASIRAALEKYIVHHAISILD
ncbi:dTMP kinase [Legionella oakridgensis]|uniref:Thymidylate kinase n=2 Tax=Legionella oakridgensis TaxID=29423 RepID=W0BDH5_9GAMM|nr:dTMP kinase [Legionella oakridgensis]AHE66687.1 thymidylate kinase [Legionella oakridgensis ATCC 33761 = DSM 21215]ETO93561.1 thymidylate kinase [Legionella oakridgensis RV-2-2007]KTD37723.1 thymidylate kinase [Legionella oakridgensis]STY19825.1 dTMP kinase [Legionella longbeachae]